MNIRFPVLSALSLGSVEYFSLLNSLDAAPHLCADLLEQMEKEGLISGSFSHGSYLSLTPAGSALLLQLLEDQRAADAQCEQRRTENEAAEAVRREERSAERTRENRHRAEDKRNARRLTVVSALLGGLVSFAVMYLAHLFGL